MANGTDSEGDIFSLEWHCLMPGISKRNVDVCFKHEFNRRPHPEHDVKIEEIWREKLKSDVRLYNGMKFRLDKVSEDTRGDTPTVQLHIGLTCYKDFQCTNYCSDSKKLQADGMKDYMDKQSYMSDPLGVSAILVTADDKVVIQKRSNQVGEYCGMLDLPGGHPEPNNVPGWKQDYEGNMDSQEVFSSFSSCDIVDEIFYSITQEVVAEINLPRGQLSEPQLVAIIRQTLSFGRPSAVFTLRASSLYEDDVKRMFNEGGEEQFESIDIEFMSLQDIKQMKWQQNSHQFTPAAYSAFYILAQN